MTKRDDSALDPEDLLAVEERAQRLLDRADAWNRFPVPIDDILCAAKVRIAPTSAFDPAAIVSYLQGKAAATGRRVKRAISKVFGLYDAEGAVIHIDSSVVESKQTFLALHETGHHDLPVHRQIFRLFQDCNMTLDAEVADKFEREANNFARFVLFKGDTFARHAADCSLEIRTPIKLAKTFGASIYAAAREFARTNDRACVVFVLDPLENIEGIGCRAPVRRIEASPSFIAQFGRLAVDMIAPNHPLWPALPIGRRMTRPVLVRIADVNGIHHECMAEALDTTYNVLVLLYPKKALTAKTVIVPVHRGSTCV